MEEYIEIYVSKWGGGEVNPSQRNVLDPPNYGDIKIKKIKINTYHCKINTFIVPLRI